MPINGGTRMLRARRKDINVKPNRRLDRKSSRGMLFENEELRMRTITINAEVEQGQHALKKLRRENEQLRREMWSLRDEYDKMEKLLRKKETDEDSDQENSDSDDNYSQTEDSDEDKQGEGGAEGDVTTEEDPDGGQTATKFGNLTTARAFDGLSVIDEQTEETTTQTTESVAGVYGGPSRGNSANRTFTPFGARVYDDGGGEFPQLYDAPYHPRLPHRRRYPAYEGDSAFYPATDWPDNGYDVRPSSPYPYPESVQPSYRKRFQVLQNLPPVATPRVPDENGWVFPGKYEAYPRAFPDGNFKSSTEPISVQIPQVGYDVIRDRAGPDVFISGACVKKSEAGAVVEDGVRNVETEIDKIEISERRDACAKPLVADPPQTATATDPCKAKDAPTAAKLTTGKAVAEDATTAAGVPPVEPVDDSVPCQNPCSKDGESTQLEDMARSDKTSKFQSKLTVTLKTPVVKADGRTFKRSQVPRGYQTLGYGVRGECGGGSKGYTPFAECRYTPGCGLTGEVSDVTASPLLPTTPPVLTAIPAKLDALVLDTEDIPVQHMQDELGLLTEVETVPPIGVPAMKPIKIPPAPPPRTTSCLGTIIPDSPMGVTALHHRTFRGGKTPVMGHPEPHPSIDPYPEPFMHNPLMLSEPMATSSPMISPRLIQRGHNLSLDNLSTQPRGLGVNANDESSTEDVSARRTRTTERSGRRVDPPHLNKSVSSPSFGTFLRRKASEHSVSSMENGVSLPHAVRATVRENPQNNASVSSSSGLDSPTKSDRRKRRVSIKFNKKGHAEDGDDRTSESTLPTVGRSGKGRSGKGRSRNEETDVTTSERERTNSVSSRASSGVAGSGRRKLSISSNRTYVNDEKIPWCGCWGNGCV